MKWPFKKDRINLGSSGLIRKAKFSGRRTQTYILTIYRLKWREPFIVFESGSTEDTFIFASSVIRAWEYSGWDHLVGRT